MLRWVTGAREAGIIAVDRDVTLSDMDLTPVAETAPHQPVSLITVGGLHPRATVGSDEVREDTGQPMVDFDGVGLSMGRIHTMFRPA